MLLTHETKLTASAFSNSWSGLAPEQELVLLVPEGLEGACAGIGRRDERVYLSPWLPGTIVGRKNKKNSELPSLLLDPPLWSFGSFVKVAALGEGGLSDFQAVERSVAKLVDQLGIAGSRYWLRTVGEDTALTAEVRKRLLNSECLGLLNDPSDYSVTMVLIPDGTRAYVLLGPSISIRERFNYRRRDVGASINPVLAACTVRLVPKDLSGVTIDPTCGSGTLLIERVRYAESKKGIGIDVSRVAQQAFSENLAHADLSADMEFRLSSASERKAWDQCSVVVANLPFGIRVKQDPRELQTLYRDIAANAAENLCGGGRLLLMSSYKSGLEGALAGTAKIRVLSRYRSLMGGLYYQIYVAGLEP